LQTPTRARRQKLEEERDPNVFNTKKKTNRNKKVLRKRGKSDQKRFSLRQEKQAPMRTGPSSHKWGKKGRVSTRAGEQAKTYRGHLS